MRCEENVYHITLQLFIVRIKFFVEFGSDLENYVPGKLIESLHFGLKIESLSTQKHLANFAFVKYLPPNALTNTKLISFVKLILLSKQYLLCHHQMKMKILKQLPTVCDRAEILNLFSHSPMYSTKQ